jgi:hypothetical protein
MSAASINHVNCDLLESHKLYNVEIICQQINALSVKGHGLSQSIANKWPWANHYATRKQQGKLNLARMEDRDIPGDLVVCSPPVVSTPTDVVSSSKLPYVACIVGQYVMGKPEKYDYTRYMNDDIQRGYTLPDPDTRINREKWFMQSLTKLSSWMHHHNVYRVAMPDHIGAGLAGGNWEKYKTMIEQDFAQLLGANCEIFICKQL